MLTLPGTIPGLLRRGSPVAHPRAFDVPCVVVAVRPGSAVVGCPYPVNYEWADSWPTDRLALDLTDATGRAHAAWYLAGDGATWCRVADEREAGPIWLASHGPRDGSLARRFAAVVPESPIQRSYLAVPALANFDPNDPRLLTDGSRWADAEALRRVVCHVAGVAP